MSEGFPNNFSQGAATSVYQVESVTYKDGKKASQQDITNKEDCAKRDFATADTASDQYHHYKGDIALMKEIGLTTHRFSIAWSRVFPDGVGEVNEAGIQYYRNLIDELLVNDIGPIVTLYHYDSPWAFAEKYSGWLSRKVVRDFAYFARYVTNEFKDKAKHWATINEQSIIVQCWTQRRYIPEELRDNSRLRYQIDHHMSPAHAIACKLVHELVPGGSASAAIGYSPVYPLTSKPEDVMVVQNVYDLRDAFYLDVHLKDFYTRSVMIYLEEHGLAPVIEEGDIGLIKEGYSDFLALNYRASECAKARPMEEGEKIRHSGANWSDKEGNMLGFGTHPGFYETCKSPNLDMTDWDWAIDPTGLEYIFHDICTRYNKSLMTTEGGTGAFDTLTEDGRVYDDHRIKHLCDHIKTMHRAIDYGAEVLAYCPWSAIDLLSTSSGVKRRYGFIYVNRIDGDLKECARIHKDSSYWHKQTIESNGAGL